MLQRLLQANDRCQEPLTRAMAAKKIQTVWACSLMDERSLYDTVINTVSHYWWMKHLQQKETSVFIFHLIKTDQLNVPGDRRFMSSYRPFFNIDNQRLRRLMKQQQPWLFSDLEESLCETNDSKVIINLFLATWISRVLTRSDKKRPIQGQCFLTSPVAPFTPGKRDYWEHLQMHLSERKTFYGYRHVAHVHQH